MGVRVPPNAFATIAQLVEHPPCKRERIGSNPIRGSSDNASIAQLAEHVTLNHQVLGSIPSGCITQTGDYMLEYIALAIICVGMMIFAIGAVYITTEEKAYRYEIDVTEED